MSWAEMKARHFCRCEPPWADRGMHAPSCSMGDVLDALEDAIAEAARMCEGIAADAREAGASGHAWATACARAVRSMTEPEEKGESDG